MADADWHSNAWDQTEMLQLNLHAFDTLFFGGPRMVREASGFSTLLVDGRVPEDVDGLSGGERKGEIVSFEPGPHGGYAIVGGGPAYAAMDVQVERHLMVDFVSPETPVLFSMMDRIEGGEGEPTIPATPNGELSFTAERRNMILPFVPEEGKRYELSVGVRLDPEDNSKLWHGLGFIGPVTSVNDDVNLAFGDDPEGGRPWMLLRNNGASVAFGGPGTDHNLGGEGSGTHPAGEFHHLVIRLDTTGSAWSVDFLVNGEEIVDTFTYPEGENPDIHHVALNGAGGDGFSYTFGGEGFSLIEETSDTVLYADGFDREGLLHGSEPEQQFGTATWTSSFHFGGANKTYTWQGKLGGFTGGTNDTFGILGTHGTEAGRPYFLLETPDDAFVKGWVLNPADAEVEITSDLLQIHTESQDADLWVAMVADRGTPPDALIDGDGLASVLEVAGSVLWFENGRIYSQATDVMNFTKWQDAYFEEAEGGAGGLLAEPLADPDQDGVVNLMEYALGTSPVTPGRDGLPYMAWESDSGTSPVFRFERPRALPGVHYRIEVSSDLEDWRSVEEGALLSTSVEDLGDGWEQVSVRYKGDATERLFMRLRVELSPF